VATSLPDLTPAQLDRLQDELLANADRLLMAAARMLAAGDAALARSLAILGVEESAKAIALHDRRVAMAHAPEGEPFVNEWLSGVWRDHGKKLRLVHGFIVYERYWFGSGPSDPSTNEAVLGVVGEWSKRHNVLKQQGFYVDVGDDGEVVSPLAPIDEPTLATVIAVIHQIGWQLRLGEHIEAKGQAESGGPLHNDGYRLPYPERGRGVGAGESVVGFEAQARELSRLRDGDLQVGAEDAAARGRALIDSLRPHGSND
jgi:AbiV family abortive infection protein